MNLINWIKKILGFKFNQPERVLWVWNIDDKEINNLIKFCWKKNIKRVFISNLTKQKQNELFENGIDSSLLIGIQSPINVKSLLEFIEKNKDFKIHLDIEQKDGDTNFLRDYEEILKTGKYEVDAQCGQPKEYWEMLNKYAESVYLMSYRDNARDIRNFAQIGLKWLKTPFYLGIETGEVKETPFISFFGKTNEQLELEIAKLNIYYMFNKNYKGQAIHYFKTYQELK